MNPSPRQGALPPLRNLLPQSLALCALAILVVGLSSACAVDTISPIRELRALNDSALKARPAVRLRGVVLHCYASKPAFIMQDESDAIFVSLQPAVGSSEKLPPGVMSGAVAEVEGVAVAGQFAPMILAPSSEGIRIVGQTRLPAPLPLTAEAAKAGRMDAHLVVVEGVVRRARAIPISDAKASLEMVFESTRLVVGLPPGETERSDLVDARIRVTGISSGIWNRQRQITAPFLQMIDPGAITVLRPAPVDPFALPARRVADIMRYRPEDTPGHRMRITGMVLHSLPDGRVFVFDGESAVCVECTSHMAVAVGDRVDAVGFPGMRERSPLLEDAVLRVTGHAAVLPEATQRAADAILEQGKDYEVVQVEAVLLEMQRTQTGIDLLLQSGNTLFKAGLEGAGSAELLARLKPGSTLSLSGLVLFSFPSLTIQVFRPNGFSLLLRSPADVRIVREPPWWTVELLAGTLGGALALVLVFALWNHFLRARARSQREIISAQARREATHEERTRLARELHDSLEQEFVGMTRQTEALEHAGPLTPRAADALSVLRQMLRLSRDNARRAVWDLRDPALLDCGLETAIRNAVQRIVHDQPVQARFRAEAGFPESIPPHVQVNLLRLAQEAVANAVKHADARSIEIVLRKVDGVLELAVTDDGRSADPGGAPQVTPAGHFGIIGMRERCEKLGGHFEFRSHPGGASVRAQIPILHPASRQPV